LACFKHVFRKYLVWILAETPAILTEVFCGFPQTLQAGSTLSHPQCLSWVFCVSDAALGWLQSKGVSISSC
jgi:hypothetical protein